MVNDTFLLKIFIAIIEIDKLYTFQLMILNFHRFKFKNHWLSLC